MDEIVFIVPYEPVPGRVVLVLVLVPGTSTCTSSTFLAFPKTRNENKKGKYQYLQVQVKELVRVLIDGLYFKNIRIRNGHCSPLSNDVTKIKSIRDER